jgi:hypothetical protein
MSEFTPVQTSKDVYDISRYRSGDLVPGSNFAIVSTMTYGLEQGKGPGRITRCESRSRGNCLNCIYRFPCDAVDLKK